MKKPVPDPTQEPLDLARIRANWERARRPVTPALPERIARVRTPTDPHPEARRILERITAIARSRFQQHDASLAPFLREASDVLARMQAASRPASDGEVGSGTEDLGMLRDQLRKVLNDLEDLFEVYARIGLS